MMNRIRIWIVASFVVFAPSGALAEPVIYRLEIDGLACPFCAYGIEKKLSKLDGVDHLATDIEAGTITVTMTEGATVQEQTVRQAVKDAGFTLRSFSEHKMDAAN